MTEDEAWDELEKRLNKKKDIKMTHTMALQIAYNALVAIDRETPYPIAKHAIECINKAFNLPPIDLEAVIADQKLTIAMLRQDILDEREACAVTCEQIDNDGYPGSRHWPSDCAKAIRARNHTQKD